MQGGINMKYRTDKYGNKISILGYGCMRFSKKGTGIDLEKALYWYEKAANKGDIYGILGLSGAGKSTLVRCINGLETFDEGEILFNDKLLASPTYRVERTNKRKI